MYLYLVYRQNGGAGERGGPWGPRHDHDAGDHGASHQRQPQEAIHTRPRLRILFYNLH